MSILRSWLARFSHPVPRGYTRVFVYGSLKPGFALWRRIADGAKVVREDTVNGVTLVSFGPYPAAVIPDGPVSDVTHAHVRGFVVDLPGMIADDITRMEVNAGYRAVTVRTLSGLDCLMYVYPAVPEHAPYVGDLWTLDMQQGIAPFRSRH